MYLQINMVKYNADREIMNIYENLQIVWYATFIYIQSTSNIYGFIVIWNHCQKIQTNTYLVTFDYSNYSATYSMSDNKGILKPT